MARTAAARALSRTDVSLGHRFDVRLASAADDEEVRRLLREHPLPGDVALTFEREPDSAIAAAIEGDVHQTMVARRHDGGEIAASASRAERNVFLTASPPGSVSGTSSRRPTRPARGHYVSMRAARLRTLHGQGTSG